MADPDCNFEMFFCDLLSLFYRFGKEGFGPSFADYAAQDRALLR